MRLHFNSIFCCLFLSSAVVSHVGIARSESANSTTGEKSTQKKPRIELTEEQRESYEAAKALEVDGVSYNDREMEACLDAIAEVEKFAKDQGRSVDDCLNPVQKFEKRRTRLTTKVKGVPSEALKPEWEEAIRQALKDPRGARLLTLTAEEMQGVCPEYPTLKPEQKATVMIKWFEAIGLAESDLKPNDRFEEDFPDSKGAPQISAGLLSMSLDDRGSKSNPLCEFNSMSDIYDPIKNLQCGVFKTAQLIDSKKTKDKTLWGAGKRYWSVLRPKVPKTREVNERHKIDLVLRPVETLS